MTSGPVLYLLGGDDPDDPLDPLREVEGAFAGFRALRVGVDATARGAVRAFRRGVDAALVDLDCAAAASAPAPLFAVATGVFAPGSPAWRLTPGRRLRPAPARPPLISIALEAGARDATLVALRPALRAPRGDAPPRWRLAAFGETGSLYAAMLGWAVSARPAGARMAAVAPDEAAAATVRRLAYLLGLGDVDALAAPTRGAVGRVVLEAELAAELAPAPASVLSDALFVARSIGVPCRRFGDSLDELPGRLADWLAGAAPGRRADDAAAFAETRTRAAYLAALRRGVTLSQTAARQGVAA